MSKQSFISASLAATAPLKRARGALVATFAAAALVGAVGLTHAASAEASFSTQVNATAACQQQYGGGVFAASFYWWSPNALYCYGLSFPASFSWVGALGPDRIENYCRVAYGADAVSRGGWWLPVFAWSCVK